MQGLRWPALLASMCSSIACLAPAHAGANPAQGGLEFQGWLRADLGVLTPLDPLELERTEFLGLHLLNITARNENRAFAKVEANLDVTLPYGLYRCSAGGEPVGLELRKLYMSLFFEHADVSLGRQIIHFGKGTVLSPMDVFTSVDYFDLEFRRRGTDVARVKVAFSPASGADLIAALPAWPGDLNEGSAAMKLFTNLAGWDLSGVGIYRYGSTEAVTGVGFKGDLVVGVHGEAVAHVDWDRGETAWEFMIGADYSIHNRWFFAIEGLYRTGTQTDQDGATIAGNLEATPSTPENGAAPQTDDPCAGSVGLALPAFRPDLFGTIRFSVNDLTSITAMLLGSVQDGIFLPTLELSHSLFQNVDTVFYFRVPVTGTGRAAPAGLWTGLWVVARF